MACAAVLSRASDTECACCDAHLRLPIAVMRVAYERTRRPAERRGDAAGWVVVPHMCCTFNLPSHSMWSFVDATLCRVCGMVHLGGLNVHSSSCYCAELKGLLLKVAFPWDLSANSTELVTPQYAHARHHTRHNHTPRLPTLARLFYLIRTVLFHQNRHGSSSHMPCRHQGIFSSGYSCPTCLGGVVLKGDGGMAIPEDDEEDDNASGFGMCVCV